MHQEIVREPIALEKLDDIAKQTFGDFTKAVVDIGQQIMCIGGELHADEEAILLEQGSAQKDLWGINIYPNETDERWIEFDSMINIRPSQSNRSRDVENAEIRAKIIDIVSKLVIR